MLNNDMALIRDYASNNSQEAFATLISRHVHVVYSIALRQVRDTHVAEEITQSVFILLASKARSLSSETILSGWLCRTARYVSANTLKAQRRRQLREQESQMQADLNEGDSSQWAQIAPLLDEALSYLGQNDHDAIVLRFFHGKELKEVGVTMGLTEDAARMRVNRALQKLRQFFAKKGVTLSAVGLAGAVSANAVQSAPAGLAAAISAAAFSGTAITTATMIATSKGVTMTILQKAIVTSCIAAVGGVGIYEARQAYFRHQTQKSKAEQVDQIRQLQRERDEATNRLASALGEVENARRNSGELLKLRNEIALARKEAEALAAAAKKAQESESELTQSMSNFPPVRTFFSTAMITTGWNKPVVTGGWRTPSGKHAIVMARAVPDENNQQALTIRSSILEYSVRDWTCTIQYG